MGAFAEYFHLTLSDDEKFVSFLTFNYQIVAQCDLFGPEAVSNAGDDLISEA